MAEAFLDAEVDSVNERWEDYR